MHNPKIHSVGNASDIQNQRLTTDSQQTQTNQALARIDARTAQLSLLIPLLERVEQQVKVTQEERESAAHFKTWALQLENLLEQERKLHDTVSHQLRNDIAYERQINQEQRTRFELEIKQERAQNEHHLQLLQRTLSWRVTAPLRWLSRAARRLLGKQN